MRSYKKDCGRRAMLVFEKDELVHDIANCCYIEGHIMDEGNEHSRHMTKDVAEDGNVERVERLLDLYHAKAIELLYPYAKRPVGGEEAVWINEPSGMADYVIALDLPRDFSQTTLDYLLRLIHEWMVSGVVGEWLSITNPAKAEVWAFKSKMLEGDISGAITYRMKGLVRPMHPF